MKPLFARILADAFIDLPPEVRALHSVAERRHFTGHAAVSASWLARKLLGFPKSGYNIAIGFILEVLPDGRERWVRDFGDDHYFTTILREHNGHLVECWAGFVDFEFVLQATPEGINWQLVGHRICGIPVPRFLWPSISAKESTENGKYQFSVEVTGLVSLAYAGWLEV